MTTRQINPNSRRFAKQVLKSVLQGRAFGKQRRIPRGTQAATTSATPVTLVPGNFFHEITTDGTGVARVVNVGVTGQFPGQRKIVRLATRTGGSDTFTMDAASLVKSTGAAVASLTFNAAGQNVYIEWNGAKWTVLSTTAVLV